MPQVGYLPRQSANISGVVAPGAVLRFYQTGSSTPQNAYTDADLQNAVTSLTADAAGLLAKWYLNPNAAADYRYTLETSAGSVYYTEDSISRLPIGQGEIGAALYPRTSAEAAAGVTPQNYVYPPLDARRYLSGTAYATAIQNAIEVAHEKGGGIVYLDASVDWNIGSTTIVIYDGVWIYGSNYVFNGSTGSIVTYTGSGNAFESATRSATRIWSGGFRQLKIKGNSKVAGSCGIDARRVDDFTFDNVWCTDLDIGLRFDGTGSGGYRNRVIGGGYTHNNTGIQVINAANEQRIYAAQVNNNTNYGLDVQDGNSIQSIGVNYETNGVHVRTADQNTTVVGGRMESATVRPWETTSAAEWFHIGGGIYFNSTNTATPLDAGKFTRIDWRDHDSARGYNMVRNGSFEQWSSGTSSAPDRWTLNASTTIARDTDEQHGTYSALITAGATSAGLFHDISLPLLWADGRREFLVTVRAKRGTSTQCALNAAPQDGGGTTQGVVLNESGAVATGNRINSTTSGWHTLKLIVRPNSSATRIRVNLEPDTSAGTGTAYFDAINVSPLGAGREEFYENFRDIAPQFTRIVKTSVTHDFGAADGDSTTVSVPGAVVGDPVLVTVSSSTGSAANVRGHVSGADTVTLVKMGTGDPGSITYIVTVLLTS